MKGFLAFGALLAAILLGLGLWTATPMGGGGLGDEGGAGRDQIDEDPGVVAEDREREEPAQDGSDAIVEIREGGLMPATVEVPPRSTITFLNRDDIGRSIDFDDEQLEDAMIRPGAAHRIEVPSSGTFAFTVAGDDGEITVVPE